MTAELFKSPAVPALDSNANPLPFATWNFYQSGTLTPAPVYANAAMGSSLGSSVVADAAGRFPAMFLDPAVLYRGILKDAGGATISDFDPLSTDLRGDLSATTGSLLMSWIRAATGAVARTASSLFTERTPTPLDFISFFEHPAIYAGTSTFDAADAIEKAALLERGVKLPGRRYSIGHMLNITYGQIEGEAGGSNRPTEIRPLVQMEGILKYAAELGRIENLFFRCAGLANKGLILENVNGSRIIGNYFENARQDGIHFSVTGNNNNCVIQNCISKFNGTTVTGTAAVTGGSAVVAWTGANLTTLDPPTRAGVDFIRFGNGKPLVIKSVDSATQLTLTGAPPAAVVAGTAARILIGHGLCFMPNGDNGRSIILSGTYNSNHGAGVRVGGLYALTDINVTTEFNGAYGMSVGGYQINAPNNHISLGHYTEQNGRRDLALTNTAGTHLDSCNNGRFILGPTQDGLEGAMYIPFPSGVTNWSMEINGDRYDNRHVALLNAPVGPTALSFDKIYSLTQSGAAADPGFLLPATGTGTNAEFLRTLGLKLIELNLQAIGGRTVTVTATGGKLINGAASWTTTTSNRRMIFTPDLSGNWSATG